MALKRTRSRDDNSDAETIADKRGGPSRDNTALPKEDGYVRSDGEFESEGDDVISEEDIVEDGDMEDGDGDGDMEGGDGDMGRETVAWRPGVDHLEDGDELVYSPEAYDMLHRLQLPWPCLSFDYVPKGDGKDRVNPYQPQEFHFVAGTQAERDSDNGLYVVKAWNLCRTWEKEESEDESEDDDTETETAAGAPKMMHSKIAVPTVVNKVAVCPHARHITATYAEDKFVRVYNTLPHLQMLDDPSKYVDPKQEYVLYSHERGDEGFALEWSPTQAGVLLSGSRDGSILMHEPGERGQYREGRLFMGHQGGVEGLSCKVDDQYVFASAGADSTVRLWDMRHPKETACLSGIFGGDVNVVAFRPGEDTNQFATGSDDGAIQVFDLRYPTQHLAKFTYHTSPIYGLDWNKLDNTTLIATSGDDSVTIWDLSAEADGEDVSGVPPQLLFQHMGQSCITQSKFHPSIPFLAMSTSSDALNIWRPENLSPKALQL